MLEKIVKPEIDTVELKSDGKYGKFVLAPLERGYGITLGNSLRLYCSPHCPALQLMLSK